MNPSYKKHAFVLLVSIVFCLVQGWESIIRSWDIVNDLGDAFINMWILAWNTHALFDANLSVWDAPQFYPLKNGLALSEAMFANLWIYIPFYWITENPVFSSNMVGFISFILCAYCGYLLIEEITGNFWAGLIGGLIFSFSPYRWAHFSHLQLLPFFWAPLAILFAHRFFKSSRPKDFYGIAVTTVFQYYHSIYLGAMLTSALLTLFLIHIFLEKKKDDRWLYFKERGLRKHILIGTLLAGLVLAPLGLPYMLMASKWHIVRSFAENRLFSIEPLSFLYPNSFANYEWLRKLFEYFVSGGETQVFLGVIPWILALVGILSLRTKNYNDDQNSRNILQRYSIAGLVMAILMMGPHLLLFGKNTGIPLPYQLIHAIIPGGAAIRAPARFVQLLLLFIAILAGFGIRHLLDWSRVKNKVTQLALFFGFGVLFFLDYQVQFHPGVKAEEKKDFPIVYKYLAESNPGAPYLELPIETPQSYKYMLYQTASWRPTLNGKSGWAPATYRDMIDFTKDCPFKICVKFLEAVPVNTILIHLDQYSNFQTKLWQKIDWRHHGFSSSKVFENTLVLERDNLPELSEKLKIVHAYFSKDSHGLSTFLIFQPLEKGKHWNNFKPDKSVITISIDTHNEGNTTKTVVEKNLFSPSYVLSDIPITIPLTRLGKNLDKIQQTSFNSKKIQPLKIDKSSIIFLDKINTSQNKRSGLDAKFLEIISLPAKPIFKPKENFLLSVNILNTGDSYWLDTKYNNLIRDTDDGSVFLAVEWFPKKEIKSCIRPKTQPVLAFYKTVSNITAPEEIANFEAVIATPEMEGDYTLWIGLGSANIAWFHEVGPSHVKCMPFSVKNKH
jgi:hypothetical protein